MRCLIIPEDFRKDQHVLRPIVEALFKSLGKNNVKVGVLMEPLLGGVNKALNKEVLRGILETYRYKTDIFLLIVDRDGQLGRRRQLVECEKCFDSTVETRLCFLGECAIEELEVWALAGSKLPSEWSWRAVRSSRDPKEEYFDPYINQRFKSTRLADGRSTLGKQAAEQITRVLERCPELKHLRSRISEFLENGRTSGEPYDEPVEPAHA